jgi:ABC-type lipoprotein export system ATPase subunit
VKLLKELAASGLAIVIATHDHSLSDQCDRTVKLRSGKLLT